jgi:hypothetical protein
MKIKHAIATLCVLAVCGVSAQVAGAAGTTGFTCGATEGGAGFSDAHCVTAVGSGAKFGHTAISAGTTTEALVTSDNTAASTTASAPSKLVTKKSGVTVEIECAVMSGTGTGKNVAGPPMIAEGVVSVEFKACKVLKPLNCTITEPVVVTGARFNTFHNGASTTERGVKVIPKETIFTQIVMVGGSCVLAGTFPVEGSAIGRPSGATTEFKVGEDELTFAKEAADLQSVVTSKGRLNSGQSFTPLAVTTDGESGCL